PIRAAAVGRTRTVRLGFLGLAGVFPDAAGFLIGLWIDREDGIPDEGPGMLLPGGIVPAPNVAETGFGAKAALLVAWEIDADAVTHPGPAARACAHVCTLQRSMDP